MHKTRNERRSRRAAGHERPGNVRIIGGAWRGRRLAVPAGTEVRPTPDRVRETVFNWLRDVVDRARCLDLFAGTGALGFEALSRGATEAWLVEREKTLADALQAHAAVLGANARVFRGDARTFLEDSPLASFDIAFVDPPFERPVEPLVAALLPLLRPGALVYVERPAQAGLPDVPGTHWHKRGRAASVEFGLLSPA
jgi:16S rRNA (guanine966-N2)-methyltransferase